jgi:23S rRNA pseudouridine1911/1915/1917 synthase
MRTRLDRLVAERFGLSRRGAREAVRRGHVDVGGQTCCEPGREIEVDAPVLYVPHRPRADARMRHLRVLFEDRHVLVVDKPAGLLTQPGPDRERDTLLERAGRYLAKTRGVTRPYVGIVHRIDQGTSGAIVLVCSPRALRPFQALFRDHSIERLYLAVVEGTIEPAMGTIDMRLVADRGDGRRGASRGDREGVAAITHYEVIESFGTAASLVACRLETGRTHQIRIHLAEIGHPVVGEPIYRSPFWAPFPVAIARQALHARLLGFVHPITGQQLRVEAPLPADMAELIAALRQR